MNVSRFIILILLLTVSALSVFAQDGRDDSEGGVGVVIVFNASEGDCDDNGIDDLDDFFPPDCIGDVKADTSSNTAGDTPINDCNDNGIEDLDEFFPPDCYILTTGTGSSSAGLPPLSDCDGNGIEDGTEYNPPPCIYDTFTSDDGINPTRPAIGFQQKSQPGE